MAPEKLILIGCDDMAISSKLLDSISIATSFKSRVIVVTRVTDTISIGRSTEPDLIILCFRNNEAALNDLYTFAKKPATPLLCLSREYDTGTLKWSADKIVFIYQLEYLQKQQLTEPLINSIFNLASSAVKNEPDTLAEAAIEANRNLSRYVMELDQKAEILIKVKERITELYKQVDDPVRIELISIVNAIKTSAKSHKLWDDFKLYFEQTNPDFLWALAQKYPDLTPIDLKYCCYIKMNMGNDDIGNLLGINQESVRTHKYRLKRKMSLPREQDLRTYLHSVNTREKDAV